MNKETVMHDSKPFEIAKALRSYQQGDSDGILVMVSRQACEEGADWLEHLERECEIRYHKHTAAIAHNDRVTKILLGIYALLHPKDFHADDGQIFRFVAPNPNELLRELAKHIRAIPDKLESLGEKPNDNISNWQLIETAPKDGTSILLSTVGYINIEIGYWTDFSECWYDYDGHRIAPKPTHWMPLPAAPNAELTGRGLEE